MTTWRRLKNNTGVVSFPVSDNFLKTWNLNLFAIRWVGDDTVTSFSSVKSVHASSTAVAISPLLYYVIQCDRPTCIMYDKHLCNSQLFESRKQWRSYMYYVNNYNMTDHELTCWQFLNKNAWIQYAYLD